MEEITNTSISKYIIIFIISVIQLGTIAYLSKLLKSSKNGDEEKFNRVYDKLEKCEARLSSEIEKLKTKLTKTCILVGKINTRCKERVCKKED